MRSLIKDLKTDSVNLVSAEKSLIQVTGGLDTLIHALRQPLSIKKNIQLAYVMYMKYGNVGVSLDFSDNTMSQLKNSGGLRLIRKTAVLDQINDYEVAKRQASITADDTWKLILDLENTKANYIFDFTGSAKILELLESGEFSSNTDSLLRVAAKDTLVMLNNKKEQLAIFRNAVRSSKSLLVFFLGLVQDAIVSNSKLTKAIEKEYHISN